MITGVPHLTGAEQNTSATDKQNQRVEMEPAFVKRCSDNNFKAGDSTVNNVRQYKRDVLRSFGMILLVFLLVMSVIYHISVLTRFILIILAVIAGTEYYRAIFARERQLRAIVEGNISLTPGEFFQLRSRYAGHMYSFDFRGCYVLHNLANNKYYVGQSIHVLQRVNNHFSGRGNRDVYFDFRCENPFEIHMIDITTTNYCCLNDFERDLIAVYHAYDRGYNKTRGN